MPNSDQIRATLRRNTRKVVARAIRQPSVGKALVWTGVRGGRANENEMAGIPVPARVVAYFGDGPDKLYQLKQWLPVFETLNEVEPVVLVFRKVESYRAAKRLTTLPRIFIRRFSGLMDLYESNDFELILYVNNAMSNFQSLEDPRPVHVHVNHGESDKLSMVSNRAKAYDFVFVAGPAAVERHEARLIDFDVNKLVTTGRPQLDIAFPSELPVSTTRTVMYAPTWEGENEENNYSSVDVYGISIVEGLLALSNTRVVYKPHPRVADSRTPETAFAHQRICELIEGAGTEHQIVLDGNILAMFGQVDVLVTDISSVGLDYLYLRPEKPLILTDRRSDIIQRAEDAPISRSCHVIDESNVLTLDHQLEGWIGDDDLVGAREAARAFYFDDIPRGESTTKFLEKVSYLIEDRRSRLSNYRAWRSSDDGETD